MNLSPKNLSLTYQNFKFEISHKAKSGRARLGRIHTPHGVVDTPAFIFCATKAAMKSASPVDMKEAKTQIILSNTYHLMIQPGPEVVEKMGGLHKFMGWDGPMLTDSGGFQIFSLGHGSVAEEIKGRRPNHRPKTLLKIEEEGATFRSYLDGQKYLLTPERSMQIQKSLGPDLAVVLDECTPFHVDKRYTERSMLMSHRWANRCLTEFQRNDDGRQALYGISQGGVYPDLRESSCDYLNDRPFFAYAVGGSLGAAKEQMYEIVDYTLERLRPERPVHLLGIGGIRDIFHGVRYGIDTFDCVHPTRLARHGGALVKPETLGDRRKKGQEHLNLRNAQYRLDQSPIEEGCACNTCRSYSRGYIHHLLKAKELLAYTLITVHNVFFMNSLLEAIRVGIKNETLALVEKEWLEG